MHHLLADLVVALHLVFILFAVGGGLLALRWPRVVWLQLPAVLWGAFVEVTGRVCPLTPLENALRRAGGEADYAGGFVAHYVVPLVYPAALTREAQLALAVALVAVNALVYAAVWRRRRASR